MPPLPPTWPALPDRIKTANAVDWIELGDLHLSVLRPLAKETMRRNEPAHPS